MGSRRSRRIHGRVPSSTASGHRLKANRSIKKSQRAQHKAAILVAARTARHSQSLKSPTLIALLSVTETGDLEKVSEVLKAVPTDRIVPFETVVINGGLMQALDVAKVADVLLLVFSGQEDMTEEKVQILHALRAQGLPTLFSIAVGDGFEDPTLRKLRGRQLEAESMGDTHMLRPLPFSVDTESAHNKQTLRTIFAKPSRAISWRSRYGYMLVESIAREEGRVGIYGWVRGRGFVADELIHVSGWGSFAVDKIMDMQGKVLDERGEEGESVASGGLVDDLMAEQTWPPEVDTAMEGGQAAPVDEEERLADEFDAEVEGENPVEAVAGTRESADAVDDDDMLDDMEEEMDALDEKELAKLKAARTDEQFPDEVDTPIDHPARKRFARYRGLKSFRTGEWDANEQLPREYAKLFQFRNLAATRKRVLNERQVLEKKGNVVAEGQLVCIVLRDVSEEMEKQWEDVVGGGGSLVASGMLRHENRRTVVHFGMKRVEGGGVLKAKTEVMMQCGFVRWSGRAMYSENNANCDKHKMERYFVHDRYTVVSMFGSAIYTPAPAILLWPNGGMIATGSALGADPARIILKRIVLTGYPYKTQKKKAVCRMMFFNAEDVRWFKPVELWSKLGRRGHIVEPLGCAGALKCVFDGVVMHHDTICMTLYKRVYPKITLQ